MSDMWHEGYALLLKITKNSVSFDILPYEQCIDGQLSIKGDRRQEILEKIETISRVLKDEDEILRQWRKYTEKRRNILAVMSGLGKYQIAFLRRIGLLEYFYKRSHMRYLLQMLRCEAHKEVAKELLSNYLK